ncbi:TetR/AcrR family transcriptional regulator C-terminal domain-containing protein [Macrococcus equipercicus]|uniref:TetR family transcriptional regulator n=1 Tax=Macrococcus equipercicus TaxID=69967 RepID=A0A9Q9F1Y9_9STAP|nr:TetR/AcrR family transcriptional regulator C-terminal domain-containing protein [Macrococcus equipercicus]KAA1042376.1 TetR family transcriptional regulator [Macrococcus equipercicus]UTH14260.1 TetR/AcrR family transcriptional regulator C-terminal domain-containing protein [Macrococcus equipercicus]
MKDKHLIIEAEFLNLLEKHRFREITIKMICEAAHINRSTFYAYYLDKYDLLDRMIDTHLTAIGQFVEQTSNDMQHTEDIKPLVKKYFLNLCHYIYAHQQFFKTLMTVHPAQNFTQKLIETLRSNYLASIEANSSSLREPKYFVNYTLGGQFGILFFWLQNDCLEPPELMADIIYHNILRSNR